jgi:Uma2 family endonuclease
MKAATLVPVEEYLRTSYRPDCDYVDGEVLERNVGEYPHSKLQTEFAIYFGMHRKRWNVHAVVEQRVQIAPTRFRIPDVSVVLGLGPEPAIFRDPPFVCIEILSKDDTLHAMQERIDDYLNFGVRYVWLVNPLNQRAWVYTTDGSREVKDGILRTENPEIVIPLAEIFSGLEG